jgi:hypothetical protein
VTVEAEASPVKERAKPGRRSSLLLLTGTILLALAAGAVLSLDMGFWSIPGLQTQSTQDPVASPPPVPDDSLREREAALASAEVALREREAHVKEQELQASKLLKGLMVQQGEQNSMGRVAELYALMPPHRAAPALQAMETQLAVQILRLLDNEETAAILSLMEPALSAEMLTRLTKNDTTEQTQAKN